MKLLLLIAVLLFSGCATPESYPLMPAPIVYQNDKINPFAHLSDEEKTTRLPIFFATTREPDPTSFSIPYGNTPSDTLRLGEVIMRFGDEDSVWENLYLASTDSAYNNTIDLFIEETEEVATIANAQQWDSSQQLSADQKQFADRINDRISSAGDKEIIIYVHGARSWFLSSVALTAEIEHFSGRDFIGVAFSWPSHQDIINYVDGVDIERAVHSAEHLRTLISFLSEHTTAKRINIICYSAGGQVVSRALHEMRLQSSNLSVDQLREKYKLGTILFTSADVAIENFLDRLPAISEISEKIVVTVSDGDQALYTASIIMKGGKRIGMKGAEERENQFAADNQITNFEIVDVSFGQEIRGFDITGHHYWHRHPWASSDIIILLRTDLPAERRGLSFAEAENFWYLSEDYPQKVQKAVQEKLGNQW